MWNTSTPTCANNDHSGCGRSHRAVLEQWDEVEGDERLATPFLYRAPSLSDSRNKSSGSRIMGCMVCACVGKRKRRTKNAYTEPLQITLLSNLGPLTISAPTSTLPPLLLAPRSRLLALLVLLALLAHHRWRRFDTDRRRQSRLCLGIRISQRLDLRLGRRKVCCLVDGESSLVS
jgi:hypothetical protein